MWQHFIFCPQTEEKDWAENKTIRASWKNFASIYLWVWEAMKVRVCVMPPCSRATWPEAFGFQVASSSCGTLAPMGLIRWCSSKVIVVLLNSLSHAESDRILTQMLAEDRDRKPAPGTSVLCSRSIHVFRILSFCSFWPIMSTHKELDFFFCCLICSTTPKKTISFADIRRCFASPSLSDAGGNSRVRRDLTFQVWFRVWQVSVAQRGEQEWAVKCCCSAWCPVPPPPPPFK